MFYREAGDFKTTYPQDSQTFPIKFDRYRYYAVLAVAFLVVPVRDQRLLGERDPAALPDLCHRGDRAEHPDRLLRAGQPRHRRVHGGGRLCLLQADDRVPRCQHVHPRHPVGRDHRRRSGCCSACPACGSRGSTWRWRRWRRSSSWCGCSTRCRGSTTIRPRARSARRSARCSASLVTGASAPAWATYLFCLIFVHCQRHHRAQPDTRHAGAQLDGDPRHGHRRRDHRGESAERQADGLRGLVLLRRHLGGAVLLGLSRRGRGRRGLRHPASRSWCCS